MKSSQITKRIESKTTNGPENHLMRTTSGSQFAKSIENYPICCGQIPSGLKSCPCCFEDVIINLFIWSGHCMLMSTHEPMHVNTAR